MFQNKKSALPAILFAGVVLALVFLQVLYAWKAVRSTQLQYAATQQVQSDPLWYHPEGNRLKKDILWFEQLLVLTKTDSIYLAINLRDSLVQLGLKGMNLMDSKIVEQYPCGFLNAVTEELYLQLAVAGTVATESANLPKKPVRKVVALNYQDDKSDLPNDVYALKPLRWTFTTNTNLRVIVSGIQQSADSSLHVNPLYDIAKYRLQEIAQQPFPKKYTPTLYLWLNDNDAKAIYRAVSLNSKMLLKS